MSRETISITQALLENARADEDEDGGRSERDDDHALGIFLNEDDRRTVTIDDRDLVEDF